MNAYVAAAMAILLVSTVPGSGSAAEAHPQTFTDAEQTQCQPDVFRLCNDFVPDEDKIAACMKAKRKQLSPECRKVFESHMKKGMK